MKRLGRNRDTLIEELPWRNNPCFSIGKQWKAGTLPRVLAADDQPQILEALYIVAPAGGLPRGYRRLS